MFVVHLVLCKYDPVVYVNTSIADLWTGYVFGLSLSLIGMLEYVVLDIGVSV